MGNKYIRESGILGLTGVLRETRSLMPSGFVAHGSLRFQLTHECAVDNGVRSGPHIQPSHSDGLRLPCALGTRF